MCRVVKRLVVWAIATAILVLAGPEDARADPGAAKQLIVMIDGEIQGRHAIGAGIIIGSGADRLYIATANHVVRQGPKKLEQIRVRLKFLPGEEIEAEVLSDFDRDLDLAVLSVKGVKALAIPLEIIPFQLVGAAAGLKRGDEVFTIGYPRGARWQVNVSPDRIADNTGDQLTFESLLVANGHSGGGLFDKDWNLVGMITADQPPNGVAVRIDRVLERLKRWDYPVKLTRRIRETPFRPDPDLSETNQPGDTFKDCDMCPEMVVVPAGSFMMGSPETEDGWRDREGPLHLVRIGKPFAVGRFEVTRDQFDAFVRESGYSVGPYCWIYENEKWDKRSGVSYVNPEFSQSGDHPVVCMDWADAKAYSQWLARKTGQKYRLLSEAEWEYVARAGSPAPFSFGERHSMLCRHGNGADLSTNTSSRNERCNDSYARTAPIGSFAGNKFKIHDMHGNVWEWVEDCWHESYEGAPSDGSAWRSGGCSRWVSRGGSWYANPWGLRSANRGWSGPGFHSSDTGFRVARSL